MTIALSHGTFTFNMDTSYVSITQLKIHPAKIISQADDYPLVIRSRNKIKGYLLGKALFENIISYIEDYIDKKAVREADFTQGKDFERVMRDLDI